MKKARKLGLQSLALVLMAFVLVAGVAFGMTGAWFTHQDLDGSYEIIMGHEVEFTFADPTLVNVGEGARLDHVMPGDVIQTSTAVTLSNTEATSAMYVFVRLSVDAGTTGLTTNAALPTGNGAAGAVNGTAIAKTSGEGNSDWVVYEIAERHDDNSEAPSITPVFLTLFAENTTMFTAPITLTNTVKEQPLTMTIAVIAIQKANVNVADFTQAKLDAIEAAGGVAHTATYVVGE